MINRITAPAPECRRYCYDSDDCLDLCDALACYTQGAKVSLDHLSRALGFPGKPADVDGSQVERMVQEGRIAEVAAYCETDVVSTYRIWLVYELFRGALSKSEFDESERNLVAFVRDRVNSKPHLQYLVPNESLLFPATAIQARLGFSAVLKFLFLFGQACLSQRAPHLLAERWFEAPHAVICVCLRNCEARFHFEQGRDLGFRLVYASEEWEREGKIEMADPKLFDV